MSKGRKALTRFLGLVERAFGLVYLAGRAFFAKKVVKNNKVLIIASGHLGDGLVDAPAIIALKDKYVAEGKEVYLLAPPAVCDLWKLIPQLRGLVTLPYVRYDMVFSLSGMWEMARRLAPEGYELVIGLINFSNLIYFCAGISGQKSLSVVPEIKQSHRHIKAFFLHFCDKVDFMREEENRFLGLERFLKNMGLVTFRCRSVQLELSDISSYLVRDTYLSIIVDSSDPRRNWPDIFFNELIGKLLTKYNLDVCVLGLNASKQMNQYLAAFSLRYGKRFHNFLGRTSLYEWINLIAGSNFIIGADSGAIHVAAATGTPAFCLTGVWHGHRLHPYPPQVVGEGALAPVCIYRADTDVESLPCFNCAGKTGKYGKTNPVCHRLCQRNEPCLCMQTISPAQVLAMIEEKFPIDKSFEDEEVGI